MSPVNLDGCGSEGSNDTLGKLLFPNHFILVAVRYSTLLHLIHGRWHLCPSLAEILIENFPPISSVFTRVHRLSLGCQQLRTVSLQTCQVELLSAVMAVEVESAPISAYLKILDNHVHYAEDIAQDLELDLWKGFSKTVYIETKTHNPEQHRAIWSPCFAHSNVPVPDFGHGMDVSRALQIGLLKFVDEQGKNVPIDLKDLDLYDLDPHSCVMAKDACGGTNPILIYAFNRLNTRLLGHFRFSG